MDVRLDLVYMGTLHPGATRETAAAALVECFRLPTAQAQALIRAARPLRIKRGLDATAGEHLRAALAQAGLVVRLIPAGAELTAALPATPWPTASPVRSAATPVPPPTGSAASAVPGPESGPGFDPVSGLQPATGPARPRSDPSPPPTPRRVALPQRAAALRRVAGQRQPRPGSRLLLTALIAWGLGLGSGALIFGDFLGDRPWTARAASVDASLPETPPQPVTVGGARPELPRDRPRVSLEPASPQRGSAQVSGLRQAADREDRDDRATLLPSGPAAGRTSPLPVFTGGAAPGDALDSEDLDALPEEIRVLYEQHRAARAARTGQPPGATAPIAPGDALDSEDLDALPEEIRVLYEQQRAARDARGRLFGPR